MDEYYKDDARLLPVYIKRSFDEGFEVSYTEAAFLISPPSSSDIPRFRAVIRAVEASPLVAVLKLFCHAFEPLLGFCVSGNGSLFTTW